MYNKPEKIIHKLLYILEFLLLLSHLYGCWLSKFSKPTLKYLLQIRVQAYDGGLPSLSATATIDVLVQRNLYSPVFSVLNYEVTINENAALGVPFVYVNATDADIRVFDADWHVTNFWVFLWCNFTMYRCLYTYEFIYNLQCSECLYTYDFIAYRVPTMWSGSLPLALPLPWSSSRLIQLMGECLWKNLSLPSLTETSISTL